NAGLLGSNPKALTQATAPVPPDEGEKPAAPPIQTAPVPAIPHTGPAAPAGNPFASRSTFALPAPPPIPALAPLPTQTTTVPATTVAVAVAPAPLADPASTPVPVPMAAPAAPPPPPVPAPADLQAQLAPQSSGRNKPALVQSPAKAEEQSSVSPLPAEPVKTAAKAPDRPVAKTDGRPAGGANASPARGGYTIQVGTFRDAANAEGLAKSLAARGFGADAVDWTDSHGNTWKVVRVGSFRSLEQAARQLPALKKAMGLPGVVLRLR
ncbi:MAG TPA: SPOR domain-containing protein, partial [Azospirillaceae bacterium]|nr:SPOR domain-containing protein [Azospirillaceae bacterium]